MTDEADDFRQQIERGRSNIPTCGIQNGSYFSGVTACAREEQVRYETT